MKKDKKLQAEIVRKISQALFIVGIGRPGKFQQLCAPILTEGLRPKRSEPVSNELMNGTEAEINDRPHKAHDYKYHSH
jgi:hypothetical protein